MDNYFISWLFHRAPFALELTFFAITEDSQTGRTSFSTDVESHKGAISHAWWTEKSSPWWFFPSPQRGHVRVYPRIQFTRWEEVLKAAGKQATKQDDEKICQEEI